MYSRKIMKNEYSVFISFPKNVAFSVVRMSALPAEQSRSFRSASFNRMRGKRREEHLRGTVKKAKHWKRDEKS